MIVFPGIPMVWKLGFHIQYKTRTKIVDFIAGTGSWEMLTVHACKTTPNRVWHGTDKRSIPHRQCKTLERLHRLMATPLFPDCPFFREVDLLELRYQWSIECLIRYLMVFSIMAISLFWLLQMEGTTGKVAGNLEQNFTGSRMDLLCLWAKHHADRLYFLFASSTGLYTQRIPITEFSACRVRQGAKHYRKQCTHYDWYRRNPWQADCCCTYEAGSILQNITSINDDITAGAIWWLPKAILRINITRTLFRINNVQFTLDKKKQKVTLQI